MTYIHLKLPKNTIRLKISISSNHTYINHKEILKYISPITYCIYNIDEPQVINILYLMLQE